MRSLIRYTIPNEPGILSIEIHSDAQFAIVGTTLILVHRFNSTGYGRRSLLSILDKDAHPIDLPHDGQYIGSVRREGSGGEHMQHLFAVHVGPDGSPR